MKLFQKGELKLLWPFYLDSLISTVLFFAPAFYIVFFRDLNFSLFQVGLLLAIPSLVSLLLEIPTGAIADIHGRKFSVLLGIFLEAVIILPLFFFTGFYSIAIIFALMGIAGTLISGANMAWITDLINSKDKNLLTGYLTKSESITNIGLIVAGIIGAIAVQQFGTKIIWPAATVALFISLFILSFAKENFVPKKGTFKEEYKEMKLKTRKSLSYVRRNRTLLSIIIAGVLIGIAYLPLGIGWVPFLQGLDFPDYAFGYLYSAMAAVGVIAPLLSQKLLKKGKERKLILHIMILSILSALAIIFAVNILIAIAVFIAFVFFGGMRAPMQIAYFQKFVPSKLRATIGSVDAMIHSAVGIIMIPLAGFVIDTIGPQTTIFFSAFIAVPAAIIYYRIKDKKIHDKHHKHIPSEGANQKSYHKPHHHKGPIHRV